MVRKSSDGYEVYGVWKNLCDLYGRPYKGNIHRDSNMFQQASDDIGKETLLDAMRYYFEVNKAAWDFMYFMYNYDKVLDAKLARDADRKRREALRAETKRRMEELGGL